MCKPTRCKKMRKKLQNCGLIWARCCISPVKYQWFPLFSAQQHNSRPKPLLKRFHVWRIPKARGSRSWWSFKDTHWMHCQWKRQSKHSEHALRARDLCHGAQQSFSYSHPTASRPLIPALPWLLAESVLVTRLLQLVPQPGIPGAKRS